MDLGSGIPGDGRCLFRSVVRGAHLREGKPSPCESHERELADELRAKVADEFIKRRADSEWFVEGDFDTYVRHMRQPQVWGGEPELLMSSHVLQAPITVHMWDKKTNCLKIIAEYGQEYGKESPIRVLYHGYGHYDALQSPFGSPKSKLSRGRSGAFLFVFEGVISIWSWLMENLGCWWICSCCKDLIKQQRAVIQYLIG
ncbi:Hypothetical predicted protein [Olea europaea subsp. europaea]|uniref:Ubiquitin thioesterase OTU n=2 Tax=Olea europaea subsp. europaea TaxID=158383 RepID=A0A8S0T194_OLEEU|nr:Hypothetical predicted protein [Olea europaea subsp. europaea]